MSNLESTLVEFNRKINDILSILDITSDVRLKLTQRDTYIGKVSELIHEAYDELEKKKSERDKLYEHKLAEIIKRFKKIIDDRYFITGNNTLISIQNDEETWQIINNIFYAFDNASREILAISNQPDLFYNDVEEKLLKPIGETIDKLKKFKTKCDEFLINVETNLNEIKYTIIEDYDANSVVLTENAKKEYYHEINYNSSLNPAEIGYNNQVREIFDIINKNNVFQITKKHSDLIRGNVQLVDDTYRNLSYDEIKTSMTGGSKVTALLYEFNIDMQETQKILGRIYLKWSEYIQVLKRLENYYAFQMYCLGKYSQVSVDKQKMFKFVDKNILTNYLHILRDITGKTQIFKQIDNKQMQNIINYFNQYHYFTIKKLEKFLTFIIGNLDYIQNKNNDEQKNDPATQKGHDAIRKKNNVDIDMCKGNVLDSFRIFNQFKDILDEYEKFNRTLNVKKIKNEK